MEATKGRYFQSDCHQSNSTRNKEADLIFTFRLVRVLTELHSTAGSRTASAGRAIYCLEMSHDLLSSCEMKDFFTFSRPSDISQVLGESVTAAWWRWKSKILSEILWSQLLIMIVSLWVSQDCLYLDSSWNDSAKQRRRHPLFPASQLWGFAAFLCFYINVN